jgi:SAM-dependent methyltransferase
VAYYRAMASEYDEAAQRDATQIDRAELEHALALFDPAGDVLEVAGGTGYWTVELARYASRLTVVDTSAETLAINRAKLARTATPVEYLIADIFAWWPERRYDAVFFSFWLSHVPPARFDGFWQLVDHSLLPGGRVFFIDNACPNLDDGPSYHPAGWPLDHVVRDDPEHGVSIRRLSDGRQYNIVKVYWEPDVLQQRLATLGFDISVRETGHRRCIYGHGARQPVQGG